MQANSSMTERSRELGGEILRISIANRTFQQMERFGSWNAAFWLLVTFHVTAWTLIPALTLANVSLDVAEITCYGHEHQLGYFKHPPLASWVAEAARWAAGQQAIWVIYLVAQLMVAIAFFAVWQLAKRIVEPAAAFVVVLALESSFIYTVMTLEFNHLVMVLPFIALSVWCLHQALRNGDMRWWIALGTSIGLGLMSNHIMLFLAITIAAFICVDRCSVHWLTRPHPYIAAVVALVVFLPNLFWLLHHHFAPVSYIRNRYEVNATPFEHILTLLNFLFAQSLFIGPMVIALAPWTGRWQRHLYSDPRDRWTARFLLVMVGGPFFGFLALSVVCGLKLDKTLWGMTFWLFVPLLALFALQARPAPLSLRHTVFAGLTLIFLNVIVAIAIPSMYPRLMGRALPRTQFPGKLLSKEISYIWHAHYQNRPLRVVAGEQWLAYNVAFYSPERPSVLTNQARLWSSEVDESSCPWTSVRQLRTSGGILLWYPLIEGFELPKGLRRIAPGAVYIQTLSLPWQTSTALPPVQVGVAVLPPS